jgi:Novel STAND NTPase 1
MTREQLREAVECPAESVLPRAEIAPRLIDHLLNELGDRFDRLPVLQHALLRTWDEWQRAGGVGPIDLRHFESAGGLEGALNQDAEGALKELDIGVTARVFKRLTDTDLMQRHVRSPARISELMAAASTDRGTVEKIVRRFEEGRRSFVHMSADGKPDDPRVDISHESLIRQWDRLRNWVDEEQRSRDQYKDLVARARKKAQGKAALLQDPELQTAIEWKATLTPSWAQRYSSADGDFESADRYLVESVEVRYQNLAEAELQRRWEMPWRPLIVGAEVVVGIVLAGWGVEMLKDSDYLETIIPLGKSYEGEKLVGLVKRRLEWFVRLSPFSLIVILYWEPVLWRTATPDRFIEGLPSQES